MGHTDYSSAKKAVFRGMWLLAAVTLVEVFFSLAGKGYIPGITFIQDYNWTIAIVGLVLIVLSLYKAYFIVYEFMHMGSEVKGLRMTVLLPMLLLVWAIIAFFNEGSAWKNRREVVKERNEVKTIEVPIGSTTNKRDTKNIN
jgi:cytochrome c oxidase subunit IV